MTRKIFLQLLLVNILLSFGHAGYTVTTTTTQTATDNRKIESIVEGSPGADSPVPPLLPGPGVKPPVHKLPVPIMEELPKIHRFHKERVGKMRRHRKKCWVSVKLLLIICHMLLLVCAFLHVTH